MDRRKRLFLLGSVATMLTLGGLMVSAPGALAAAPSIQTIPTNFTLFDTTDCGFPLAFDVTGFFRITTFTDANGNKVREIDSYHQEYTYTNLENGKSLATQAEGPNIVYFNADGSVREVEIGLVYQYVVPGQGSVLAEVGRLVLLFPPGGGQPQVLFQAGPNDGLFPALCNLLS